MTALTLVALVVAFGGALLLLSDARAAVLAAILALILAESQPEWGAPVLARLYNETPANLSPVELLIALAIAAVLLDLIRRGELPRLPAPFTAPLLLVLAAVIFGLLNGRLSGEAPMFAQVSFFKAAAPLFIFPLLIVNVISTREELRRAIGIGGVLAIVKAVAGLAVVALGLSTTNAPGDPALTYYAPTANWLMMISLFVIVAALFASVQTPAWARWAAPIVALSLLLSYRRSFWLAFVLCLLLIVPLATGRIGRRLLLPAAVLVALSGWLALSTGFAGELQGPVVQRAESINPAKVKRNDQDRYRLAERRNVVAELERQPLTGIGAGVDWQTRYPLNFDYPTGHGYAHMGVLWWWLKTGVLGVAAYLWLLLAGVAAGIGVWRRHPDELVRVAALGAGVGFVGIAAVELSAAMIGPDLRLTALFGILLGLLAVAHSHVSLPEPPPPPATIPR